MFKIPRLLWFFLVVAALFPTGLARATSESRNIVVVANHPDANIITSLRGELHALGLEVQLVEPGEHEPTPRELTDIARNHRAIGAFRVFVDEGRVEVWLADRVTGKVLLREVLTTHSGPQNRTDESIVVARAVELLRASLLELDISERPKGEVKPPAALLPKINPPALARPIPESQKWSIGTGIGLLGATLQRPVGASSLLVAPALSVSLKFWPYRHWGTVVRLVVPVSSNEFSAMQGRAQLTPRVASIGCRYTSGEFGHGFQASLESAMGLAFIDIAGIANTGYAGQSSSSVDPLLLAGWDISYSLSHHAQVSLTNQLGIGPRREKIVFDEDTIGYYGRYVGTLVLGVDVLWN